MYQFFKQVAKVSGHNFLILGLGHALHRCSLSFFPEKQKSYSSIVKVGPAEHQIPKK